jgi:hypothetical protein
MEIDQCCDIGINDENYISTSTTIAAIWSTEGNKLLSMN